MDRANAATAERHARNRAVLAPVRRALYDYDDAALAKALERAFHPGAPVRLAHPFNEAGSAGDLHADVFMPLRAAVPDLERRDTIVMTGAAPDGSEWVGCCGHYTGAFAGPWLDIPPTGHQASMRFHEFFRFEDGRIAEMQALWDIPEVMMQAGVWPMSPSLGREWHVPGPATGDGVSDKPRDPALARVSHERVSTMLADLARHATQGVAAMRLGAHWHPRCSWYGPSGIGTCRGIEGFRRWHQIPFLDAMPDRVGSLGRGNLFADGDYVGYTAWPGMRMTLTGDGWLGIAPAGQKLTMRSLDFWRCENGLIRENWVLIDLLDVYAQLGVDVFARMREFAQTRRGAAGRQS